jgi:hypothetical protein
MTKTKSKQRANRRSAAPQGAAHEWTIDDVWAGRLICKPPGPCGAGEGWFAKWCYKIGWHTRSGTSKDHYTMIAMSDGMTHTPRTKEAILEWLKAEDMVPMREEWWRDACHWMRNTLGFVQNASDQTPRTQDHE